MTLHSLASDLASRAPAVLFVLAFRSVPFVVYACVARSLSWPRRLVIVGGGLLAGFGALRLNPSLAPVIACVAVAAYLLLSATFVHGLAGWLPRPWIRGGAVLVVSALVLLILPAAFVHHAVVSTALILGWELTLKAHSYCVEASASERRPDLREGLFFLLVNPTVLYPERGGPIPERAVDGALGALRIALGVVTMLGRDVALIATGGLAFLSTWGADESWGASAARFFATQIVLVLGFYCAHSGLASIQIGWMRLLGHVVPERYRYPILAKDPQDFWHRWNIWISRWAQRYLFVPIARALGHRRRGRWGALVAALLAFVAIGVLHDVGIVAMHLEVGQTRLSAGFTVLFLFFGLVLIVWAEIARKLAPRMRRTTPGSRAVLRVGLRVVVIGLAVALSWIAMPVLRTGQLPPELGSLVRRVTHGQRSGPPRPAWHVTPPL